MSDCNSNAYGWDPILTRCNINDYEYQLFSCDTGGTCNTTVHTHPQNSVCNKINPLIQLDDCQGTWNGIVGLRYYCYIIAGPVPNKPDQDAFIEWYWQQDTLVAAGGMNDKLTWMASKEWINYCWNQNGGGYTGVQFPNGIPLFNPSNHNPN
jgi:hypothetical protein